MRQACPALAVPPLYRQAAIFSGRQAERNGRLRIVAIVELHRETQVRDQLSGRAQRLDSEYQRIHGLEGFDAQERIHELEARAAHHQRIGRRAKHATDECVIAGPFRKLARDLDVDPETVAACQRGDVKELDG